MSPQEALHEVAHPVHGPQRVLAVGNALEQLRVVVLALQCQIVDGSRVAPGSMSWMSVEPGATRLPNVAKVFALPVLPRPSRMKIELPGSSQPSATRPLPETIISTHSPSFDKNAQFVLHRRMVSPSAARGEQKRGSPRHYRTKGPLWGNTL